MTATTGDRPVTTAPLRVAPAHAVALLAVSIFAAVFGGVTLVLLSSRTSEAPGRHPITPPSGDS
jgi:hypothetical protein